jgi:hypothetical protein
VISVVLAHEVVHLGPVVLPSSHGFTLALLISIGAAVVAFAFSQAIPRAPRVPAPDVVPDRAADDLTSASA